MSDTTPSDERLVASRYRLQSVLGSGSMGTVWSAFDEFLRRPVAVKEIRIPSGVPSSHADEVRERTLREARAIAGLTHPNVVVLYDVVRENGDPYVVMELMPAKSLAELMQRAGTLTVPQAAALAESVAGALGAAHAKGITHRDVKPGNVLVAPDGRIKLTDFGIARNMSEATMTHTGMMLGSPAYIAPEVAAGGTVAYTADLWGLGATLFAALEGKPPYDVDGDPIKTVSAVVNGSVPQPSPGPLAPLVRGLMRKEPADRMSLAEVHRRLHALLNKPRHTLFGPELFAESDDDAPGASGGATQVIPQLPPPRKAAEPPADEPPAEAGQALAADPGPLPFAQQPQPATPTQPRPTVRLAGPQQHVPPPIAPAVPAAPTASAAPIAPKTRTAAPAASTTPVARRAPARTVVVVLAALLYLLAAAGGFALTRLLAGESVTPPSPVTPTSTNQAAQPPKLVPRKGDATNADGTPGGLFTVRVPEGWSRFVTQRPARALPASTLVQFVSADGTQVVGVERFVDFFPYNSVDGYIATLSADRAEEDFVLVSSEPSHRAQGGDGHLLTYRSADRAGSGPEINRTTFAEVFQDGPNLWVISVTVPLDQEKLGRTQLFDRILPTFSQTH